MSDQAAAGWERVLYSGAHGLSESELPRPREQLGRGSDFKRRMLTETGQARPPSDSGMLWLVFDPHGWGKSCAGSRDGAILDTLEEGDACSLTGDCTGEVKYSSPGSYLYAFKLRGKNGYERTMAWRMLYVPSLPLPLIFAEEDAAREGYYINRWAGGLELNTHLGDVIELVDPNKRRRGPGGWVLPEPFTDARWMQVEPMNDPKRCSCS